MARSMIWADQNPNEGHGHVFPRPDGVKYRCGGPKICPVCAIDAATVTVAQCPQCIEEVELWGHTYVEPLPDGTHRHWPRPAWPVKFDPAGLRVPPADDPTAPLPGDETPMGGV